MDLLYYITVYSPRGCLWACPWWQIVAEGEVPCSMQSYKQFGELSTSQVKKGVMAIWFLSLLLFLSLYSILDKRHPFNQMISSCFLLIHSFHSCSSTDSTAYLTIMAFISHTLSLLLSQLFAPPKITTVVILTVINSALLLREPANRGRIISDQKWL